MSDEAIEQLQVEVAELRKLKRLFEDSQKLAQLGSWEWDFPSNRVFLSDAIFDIYGLTPDRFDGTIAAVLLATHPDDRAAVEQARHHAITEGKPFELEHRIIRPDGSTRLLKTLAEVFDHVPGERFRLVGVSQDITERKQLELTLRTQYEQLKELDRVKGIFMSSVTHEIRTPLTSIRGFAEFLSDQFAGPLTPEQSRFVGHIKDGTSRLEHLVTDLVEFARLDAGTFRLKRESVEVTSRIQQVAQSLQPQPDAAQLKLEVKLPPEPLRAVVDPQRIAQVVSNLVSNATKFTPPGGVVRVTVAGSDSELRCEVQDTGIGIALDDLPRLFHRFSQLESGARKGGMGLGLSISKAIVEAHGGSIGVSSEPNQGSTFWFALPLNAPVDELELD